MSRILLVDDNLDFLKVQLRFLESLGHQVECARDGKEGFEISQTQSFDLIISDILMPEREGIESIRGWRKEFPNIKILAISGGGSTSARENLTLAAYLGANATLMKPYSLTDLRQKLAELLGNG